jgi:hypothetical protein
MEPPAVFTGGSASLSATDAWAEPQSVIQNSALKMAESPFFKVALKRWHGTSMTDMQ